MAQQSVSGGDQPILVIDDDADVLQVVRAAERHPSVVVLDIGLGHFNGVSVAAGLRRVCGERLPILVMTADGRAAQKAHEAGAYAYLHKPFEDEALVEAVQRGLSGSDH
jgi:DNA-binding response OmpR family regulator